MDSLRSNLFPQLPPEQITSKCPITKQLWDKISNSTKKYLTENNFVIPSNLKEGNYRYYNVDNSTIVIDFDSKIGHGNISPMRFGQDLKTKEFLAFKRIMRSVNNPEVIGLSKLNRLRAVIDDNGDVWIAMKIINGIALSKYDYGIDVNISLISWQNIFEDLKRNKYIVIVECEDKDEPDFIIGPIKRIAGERVNIQNFDPAGQLDSTSTIIKYREITTVTFGDRYSKTLGSYLKPAAAKK